MKSLVDELNDREKEGGFKSGSINVGTMFREDQSENVTQGIGENKKSLRDRTMKSLANKTNQ